MYSQNHFPQREWLGKSWDRERFLLHKRFLSVAVQGHTDGQEARDGVAGVGRTFTRDADAERGDYPDQNLVILYRNDFR